MKFNLHLIAKITGFLIMILSISMIVCIGVALYYKEYQMVNIYISISLPLTILALILIKFTKPLRATLRVREGILIVALGWLLVSILGSIPYILAGEFNNIAQAFFESTSAFTASGATILDSLESMPRSLLFWRFFSQWIGGMGIILFAISILPALGIGAQNLAKAETPGPVLEKIGNKMTDNAKLLYLIYTTFTLAEVILLKLGGLSIFDSLLNAFSSMSTSGLTNYDAGIGHFNSFYVEIIISVFSILASINFISYWHIIRGNIKEFLKEAESRYFISIIIICVLIVTISLLLSGNTTSLGQAARLAFIHVVSFITTSGYSTVDYDMWPSLAQFVLIFATLVGGCSASTAGSIKVIRVVVMFKIIKRSIKKRLHPRAVTGIKVSGKTVSAETVSNISVFILVYFIILIISTVILSIENFDLMTTFTAALAALSNLGSGFGGIGPGDSFANFSNFGLSYLALLFLVGRLEIFTIIVLLTKTFWRPDTSRY